MYAGGSGADRFIRLPCVGDLPNIHPTTLISSPGLCLLSAHGNTLPEGTTLAPNNTAQCQCQGCDSWGAQAHLCDLKDCS